MDVVLGKRVVVLVGASVLISVVGDVHCVVGASVLVSVVGDVH